MTLTLVLGPLLETIWGSLDLQCDFSSLDIFLLLLAFEVFLESLPTFLSLFESVFFVDTFRGFFYLR